MTILITTGTGKTGHRVAARLSSLGVPHRVGSRSGAPGTTPFDWHDPDTWGPALAGAQAVYLAYAPDLATPGAVEAVGALADRAAAGARRLVLLSGRGEDSAREAERRVASAGAEVAVVRAAFFMQNFSESFLSPSLRAGSLAMPVDGVREPFVDADDVADVVVAALLDDRHAGETYEVTGPELLSFPQAVDAISAAAGRPVRFVPVTVADYTAGLIDAGLSAPEAAGIAELFATVLDGRNARLADGVRRALGRDPRPFGPYVRSAAADGAWS